jgi:phosphoribosylformylglycinamidine synthase
MVAKGGLGADIELEAVHQREPNMTALEILLSESQERMCYEVAPENVADVKAIAQRYDLGASVVGEVTDGSYRCTFEGETVVDVDAHFLGEGAPMNDLPTEPQPGHERNLPDVDLDTALKAVLSSPNTASKRWVYRQYDHEVQVRSSVRPGDDAAVLSVREADVGLAFSSGADPNWTDAAPYDGARAVALENATNLAAKGALPHAAVNCLNGGNPEKPDLYGGFSDIVDGLADMCRNLDIPVVGGNVSLYNDSPSGPIPPTPTLAVVGTKDGYDAPSLSLSGEGKILVVGDSALGEGDGRLGGSEYLAQFGGTDTFPTVPEDPSEFVETAAAIANQETTRATHDVSHGGLAVTLAEMITADAGASVSVDGSLSALFDEQPGLIVIETTAPDAVRDAFDGVAPVAELGNADGSGSLSLSVADESADLDVEQIRAYRNTIEETLE